MSEVHFIAFYGTLMKGGKTPMHPLIANHLLFIGECLIPGKLYDLGDYPALKPGKRRIKGEMYAIKDLQVLVALDKYESTDDDPEWPGYSRKNIRLIKPRIVAWCYFFNGAVREETIILSDSWHEALEERTFI